MIPPRRSLPDFKVLQTFEAAARHGNFTRAADELALTQSAVSRQIRELEDQLGQPLFERLRGKVALTPSGAEFLPQVRRLLGLAEKTMRQASAIGSGGALLSINALPTFSARWLMPRLPRFAAAHPELRFDLTTRRDIFDFAEQACDVAIHYGKPIWPGATCRYLCSEVLVPVAGGALARQPLSGPEALLTAPKIHLSDRPDLWRDWFTRHGVMPEQAQTGHWFDQFALTIEAVKAGMGYALLPLYLIEQDLRSGALRQVLDLPHSTDQAYHIVVPEGRGEAVAPFCDWLLSEVKFRPLA